MVVAFLVFLRPIVLLSSFLFLISMKKVIKYLSLINIIGLSIASFSLILFTLIKPLAWRDFFILINLLTSVPFIITGVISLKNIHKPNNQKIQNMLIAIFLILWLELGGLATCIVIFILALWVILKIKEPLNKMLFINIIGLFTLFLNSFLAFTIINSEI